MLSSPTPSANSRRRSFGTPLALKLNSTTDAEFEDTDSSIKSPVKTPNGRRSIGGARRRSFGTIMQAGAVEERPMSKEDKAALKEMYSNVIKMSTENKITSKNAWSLNVLDNMETFVEDPDESSHALGYRSINFQRASCTLDASVKIYSCRVDDTHQASFRVLENLTRNGKRDDDGSDAPSGNANVGDKATSRKFCVANTLEKNPKALNAGNLDQTCAVDPLFHKMSQLFDGGGAYGMLLVNMSLAPDSGGCCIAFGDDDRSAEFECDMQMKDFSTALSELGSSFAAPQGLSSMEELCPQIAILRDEISKVEDPTPRQDEGPDQDDDGYCTDDNSACEDNDEFCLEGFDEYEAQEPITGDESQQHQLNHHFLDSICSNQMLGNEYSFFDKSRVSSLNQWAGARHWKFTNKKPEINKAHKKARKDDDSSTKKRERFSIDFTAQEALDGTALSLAAGGKTTLTEAVLKRQSRNSGEMTLPDDSGVQVQDLGRLFLRPNAVLSLQKKGTNPNNGEALFIHDPSQLDMMDDMETSGNSNDDNDGYCDEGFEDADGPEGLNTHQPFDYDRTGMVAPSRVVNEIHIRYARVAKRVDVRQLKQDLWGHISTTFSTCGASDAVGEAKEETQLSFKDVIGLVDAKQGQSEVSLPFYFICMLHLANEKNLRLDGNGTLDDMVIDS